VEFILADSGSYCTWTSNLSNYIPVD